MMSRNDSLHANAAKKYVIYSTGHHKNTFPHERHHTPFSLHISDHFVRGAISYKKNMWYLFTNTRDIK